jgi:hypothetical protein
MIDIIRSPSSLISVDLPNIIAKFKYYSDVLPKKINHPPVDRAGHPKKSAIKIPQQIATQVPFQ